MADTRIDAFVRQRNITQAEAVQLLGLPWSHLAGRVVCARSSSSPAPGGGGAARALFLLPTPSSPPRSRPRVRFAPRS